MSHTFIAKKPPKRTATEKLLVVICFTLVTLYVGFFQELSLLSRIISGFILLLSFIPMLLIEIRKNTFGPVANITIQLPSRYFIQGQSFEIKAKTNDKNNIIKSLKISICVKEAMHHFINDKKQENSKEHTIAQKVIYHLSENAASMQELITVNIPKNANPSITFLEDNMYPLLPTEKEGYSLGIEWALRVEAKSKLGLIIQQDYTIVVGKDEKHLQALRDEGLDETNEEAF